MLASVAPAQTPPAPADTRANTRSEGEPAAPFDAVMARLTRSPSRSEPEPEKEEEPSSGNSKPSKTPAQKSDGDTLISSQLVLLQTVAISSPPVAMPQGPQKSQTPSTTALCAPIPAAAVPNAAPLTAEPPVASVLPSATPAATVAGNSNPGNAPAPASVAGAAATVNKEAAVLASQAGIQSGNSASATAAPAKSDAQGQHEALAALVGSGEPRRPAQEVAPVANGEPAITNNAPPPGPAPNVNVAAAGANTASPTNTEKALPGARTSRPAPRLPSSSPLGMSAAQQEAPMKQVEKQTKSAESSEQNLPVDAALAAPLPPTPASPDLISAAPSTSGQAVANVSSPTTPATADVSASSSTVPANSTPTEDGRLRALERTHDLVALHALRLQQSTSDTMRVVVKPGDGTQLSLELRMRNDVVEAQATLHRGDFDFLSHHWTDLQQRLEPRGVHLAALDRSASFTGNSHQSGQSSRQRGHQQPAAGALPEFAFGGSMSESPATRRNQTKTHRGWESWA